jgi:hypothetical protein
MALDTAFDALRQERRRPVPDLAEVRRHAGRMMALIDEGRLTGPYVGEALAAARPYVDAQSNSESAEAYRMTAQEVRLRRAVAKAATESRKSGTNPHPPAD